MSAPIGPGWLVLVVGPSGAGKDTLLAQARRLLRGRPDVAFPLRTITRSPDETEVCQAVSEEAFAEGCAAGAFALHWRAHGLGYGIPAAIDEAIRAGGTVVLNVSRGVIPRARERYENLRVVRIDVAPEVRARRLAGRGRETAEAIASRLAREAALAAEPAPDVTIWNDGTPEEGGQRLADGILGATPAPETVAPRQAV